MIMINSKELLVGIQYLLLRFHIIKQKKIFFRLLVIKVK